MITARMTQAVIAPLLATRVAGDDAALLMVLAARAAQKLGSEIRKATGAARIDIDDRAHADTKRRLACRVIDADAHRNALHDLDPVARRVLRRQQREAG